MRLTQQQIDHFNREGWLFLPELFRPEEVSLLARGRWAALLSEAC